MKLVNWKIEMYLDTLEITYNDFTQEKPLIYGKNFDGRDVIGIISDTKERCEEYILDQMKIQLEIVKTNLNKMKKNVHEFENLLEKNMEVVENEIE